MFGSDVLGAKSWLIVTPNPEDDRADAVTRRPTITNLRDAMHPIIHFMTVVRQYFQSVGGYLFLSSTTMFRNTTALNVTFERHQRPIFIIWANSYTPHQHSSTASKACLELGLVVSNDRRSRQSARHSAASCELCDRHPLP
jgi:hypothetical protein